MDWLADRRVVVDTLVMLARLSLLRVVGLVHLQEEGSGRVKGTIVLVSTLQ